MSDYDVLLKNGLVVTEEEIKRADLAISGEKIAALEEEIDESGAEKVRDVEGKYILPGIIDSHTHPVYLDGLGGLSRSAAHGGVTTVIHYAYAKPDTTLIEAIEKFQREGRKDSYLDFGLHGGIFDPVNQSEEIPKAAEKGVTSFKMFMTYAKLGWMTDDYQLMRTMDIISEVKGLGMVHAENGLATDYLQDRNNEHNLDPRETFLSTRPAKLEAEAINRAIKIAQVAGCPLYIPHLSSKEDLKPVVRAKKDGFPVYAETCPQYLSLTNEEIFERGPLAKIGPPLRSEADNEGLWEGLKKDDIDTIASDHAPKPKQPDDDFFDAPYGSPQTETMLEVAYHHGVNGGHITLPELVKKTSAEPARIFGLFPEKGTLKEGTDADLVVFDGNKEHEVETGNQHSNASYTLYEGRKFLGKPLTTYGRGKKLLDEGKLHAEPGRGNFLKTSIDYQN